MNIEDLVRIAKTAGETYKAHEVREDPTPPRCGRKGCRQVALEVGPVFALAEICQCGEVHPVRGDDALLARLYKALTAAITTEGRATP